MSVCGCLSRLSLCGPVMDWRPVQGVPRLSPNDRWDKLQLPHDPTDGLDGIENGWMDGPAILPNREDGLVSTGGINIPGIGPKIT